MKITVEKLLNLIYLRTNVAIIDDEMKIYLMGTKELKKCLKWEVVKIEPIGSNTIVLTAKRPEK